MADELTSALNKLTDILATYPPDATFEIPGGPGVLASDPDQAAPEQKKGSGGKRMSVSFNAVQTTALERAAAETGATQASILAIALDEWLRRREKDSRRVLFPVLMYDVLSCGLTLDEAVEAVRQDRESGLVKALVAKWGLESDPYDEGEAALCEAARTRSSSEKIFAALAYVMRHAWTDGTYGGIYDEPTDILGLARRNLDPLHAHAFATLITTWLSMTE